MNIVTKSILTLSIGFALSSAVSAQSAPTPAPKSANEPAKVEHTKHKAPATATEPSKTSQPMAAGKQLPAKGKEVKENKENKPTNNLQPAKPKHEKSPSTSSTSPSVKSEPAAKPNK